MNNAYRKALEQAGLVISGQSPDGDLVEIIELKNHPWFLGCQFHPEFKSNPMNPHPLFRDFIKAAKEQAQGQRNPVSSCGCAAPDAKVQEEVAEELEEADD